MIRHGIKHYDIVLAQIRLETANLTHKNYTEKKNLFGFKRNGEVLTFSSEDASIKHYKTQVYAHYKGGDYYKFLTCMYKYKEKGTERCVAYCPESSYIDKLKEF